MTPPVTPWPGYPHSSVTINEITSSQLFGWTLWCYFWTLVYDWTLALLYHQVSTSLVVGAILWAWSALETHLVPGFLMLNKIH
ncbi:hypothetical protein DSO57_1020849 [Entomophthora muscae]|uniref:Uncharacterized protein n=1 Tax=Entomophthora muscae TaxID=34485 RepID=A0ACC2UPF3_9FUNG|nr:hypothetical protein DSO57_1020849 [Entomophthora muscae]